MSRHNPKCGVLVGEGLRQRPPSRAKGGAGRVIKQRSRSPPMVAASSPQGAAGSGLAVSLRDPCCSSRLARGGSEPTGDLGVVAQGPHGPSAASPGASPRRERASSLRRPVGTRCRGDRACLGVGLAGGLGVPGGARPGRSTSPPTTAAATRWRAAPSLVSMATQNSPLWGGGSSPGAGALPLRASGGPGLGLGGLLRGWHECVARRAG